MRCINGPFAWQKGLRQKVWIVITIMPDSLGSKDMQYNSLITRARGKSSCVAKDSTRVLSYQHECDKKSLG